MKRTLPAPVAGKWSDDTTIVDYLRARDPEQPAYTFLDEEGRESAQLTCGELDDRARAVAAMLREHAASGRRALLLYPPGLEFIAAFLGCLYEGVVAVPAYPPRPRRVPASLAAIARNAEPRVVLTTSAIRSRVEAQTLKVPDLQAAAWLATDGPAEDPGAWTAPGVEPGDLAFLQYTSGSTAAPKGVMVTHGNLLHNEEMIRQAFAVSPASVIVGWLPLYHDMGLIGNVLQPLYAGARAILMSPMSFLQKPVRWLEAITRYRATTSGGPNFAYDLCLRKISGPERAELDLSSWTVAFNGAEPVRAGVLEEFAERFAASGFRREALYPCYGLAEATLFVTGGAVAEAPVIERGATEEASGRSRERVGCGHSWLAQKVLIVDPETRLRCPQERVGEIWVAGPHVARGYANDPEATAQVFAASLADTGEGPFLRTGDLGFLRGEELFVTGRLKDLVIVRGRNHYPQDLELTSERSHPALEPSCGAAFPVEAGGEERVVVVQEIGRRRHDEARAAAEAVRRALAEEHELAAHEVVIVRTGTVPKTTSGKIRRRACRDAYLAAELTVIARTGIAEEPTVPSPLALTREALAAADPERRAALLDAHLRRELARLLRLDPADLDAGASLTGLGLDSLLAVELRNALETGLDVPIPVSRLLEDCNLTQLAQEILSHADETPAGEEIPPLPAGPQDPPLSFAQQRVWFLERLMPGTAAYNVPTVVRLEGSLRVAALEAAFRTIVGRHETLRTRFPSVDGRPVQVVAPASDVKLPIVDLSGLAGTRRRAEAERLTTAAARRPFDPETGPLLRIALWRLAEREHVLLVVLHHLICDGWSLEVLGRELEVLYRAFTAGRPSPLPELTVRYADFCHWQRRRLQGEVLAALVAYWRDQLGSDPPVPELPTDRPRSPAASGRGVTRSFAFPARQYAALKARSQAQGVTPFMALLAVFETLVYRISGQREFLVGAPVAERDRTEFEGLIGFFVNTLALPADLAGDPSWRELGERVRGVVLGAFAHQELPFDKLVEELQPDRDPSRSPLFRVWFAFHKTAALQLAGLRSHLLEVDRGAAQVDFSLDVVEGPEGLEGRVEYLTDLFDATTIRRLERHFLNLLRGALAEPERPISTLPLLAEAERHELVREWNDTRHGEIERRCLHRLFEERSAAAPERLAVVLDHAALSYGELNRRADQLAQRLCRRGIGPESLVGISMERSVELVVGLLGILKAGGAYLPLDPSYPRNHLAFMLRDNPVRLVLSHGRWAQELPADDCEVLRIDAGRAQLADEGAHPPLPAGSGRHLAYLLYTSGSTGRPKGIGCCHAGVINLLEDFAARQPLGPGDGCSWWTSLGFDVSVYEIFSPLVAGATLKIVPERLRGDGPGFVRWLEGERIRSAYVPPFFLRDLAARLEQEPSQMALRRLLVGVEPIPEPLLAAIRRLGGLELINGYGPAEATVCATLYPVSERSFGDEHAPIGRPVRNLDVHLLDRRLQPVPIGVAGGLHIRGIALARGYLNRPGLTAEQFIPDPFGEEPGQRLYCTGDLARRLADGTLRFLGRGDDQVKIRGFRIEPREIEMLLRSHPAVDDAAVLAPVTAAGHRRLVAYLAPSSSDPEDADDAAPPALDTERVTEWRNVYDEFYTRDFSTRDPSLNLRVWTSSYTGESIPEEEVLERVERTVARVLELRPERVLEIGCGTGLLLRRIAPHCAAYWGTDVSQVGLDYLREQLAAEGSELPEIRLLRQAAHELDPLPQESFDLVVVNEVLQLFPGVDYLLRVLEGAVGCLEPGGFLFLGGVRSLPLAEAFHASVAFARARPALSQAELRARVREQLFAENELLLAPDFFLGLRRRLPALGEVRIELLGGRHHNELTRFKYDVVLRVKEEEKEKGPSPVRVPWSDWRREGLSVAAVEETLRTHRPEILALARIPNARLVRESRLLEWLHGGGGPATVAEMRQQLAAAAETGVDPEQLWALGAELPYTVSIQWTGSGAQGDYEAVFARRDAASGRALPPAAAAPPGIDRDRLAASWESYASNPLREKLAARIVPRLRGFLQENLPEHMVPSAFVLLPALPLTPHGKVDRRALPPPEDASKAVLERSYAAPRTAVERQLARIWEALLSVERVGIHDNFFELGGDSILSIQVTARAAQAGLRLTPAELFTHQTIAELAAIAVASEAVRAEQGLVRGEVPLTPVQRWFFEQDFAEPDYWNMPLMLEFRSRLDPARVAAVVAKLVEHHDALRLRFIPTAAGREQIHAAPPATAPCIHVDLGRLPEAVQGAAVEALAARLQATLELAAGRLLRGALFDLGPQRASRLLLVVHHLVIDGISWRILLEDFQTATRQLDRGEAIALAAKTTSFKAWARRSVDYARSPALGEELAYWLAACPAEAPPLPVDFPAARATDAALHVVSVTLGRDETAELLREVPRAYRTRINDVLLTALVEAFAGWTGRRSLLLDLEGHGREEIVADVDLSRTVGWFTTVFPVWLDLAGADAPGAALMRVKERLRSIPHGGIGYGLLRYGRDDDEIVRKLSSLPQPEVVFNYLGQFDQLLPAGAAFRPAAESCGPAYSPRGHRSHLLEINARVVDDRLVVDWAFGANVHRPATIERLADDFLAALRALVAHCLSPQAGGYTPSDFPLAGVDQETLDRLLAGDRETEDLYALSPMQEGMLFHSLFAPQGGVYVTQVVATLRGLRVAVLEQQWRRAVDRHPALRTAFVWEKLERPLQRVVGSLEPVWEEEDWRALAEGEQHARWEELLRRDRERGFDLARPPLLRLVLVRVAEESWRFLWSHHHLLLDGWSMARILREVFSGYEAFCAGDDETAIAGPAARDASFRDYVAWLRRQDAARAEAFWRRELAGLGSPTRLAADRAPDAPPAQEEVHVEADLRLAESETAALRALARQHRLTVNNLVQGAWVRVLSAASGSGDVVFGATVSGRPAELPEVEAIVGLLINTLPARVRVDSDASLMAWLQAIQARQAAIQEHGHRSLVEIQGWSEVPRGQPLFESILVFENYPLDASLRQPGGRLEIADADVVSRTHFPLTLLVVPDDRLLLRIAYDVRRFDGATVGRMLVNLRTWLTAAAAAPERRVGEVPLIPLAERHQLLHEWNDEAAVWPRGECVHDLVASQAERTPEAIAAIFADRRLSYAELERRANQLAHHLRRLGIGAEARVGICVDRSLETVVGLYGILKAGAAYLPLDPSYPGERLAFMLDDAAVDVILTQEHLLASVPQASVRVICLDRDWPRISGAPATAPPTQAVADNLAYLIYTSGSTGRPKGTALSHRALVNLIRWHNVHHDVGVKTLQFSSLSFDLCFHEAFSALSSGGSLVMIPESLRLDTPRLARYLVAEGIVKLMLPVTALQHLAEEYASWERLATRFREVISTAEQLQITRSVRTFLGRLEEGSLHNHYGPAETHVVTSHALPGDPQRWPVHPAIGRPLANTRIYLLDRELGPVPLGVPGELTIGGVALARGYHQRPGLTAERFLPDPYAADGGRLYRTGDLARYLEDGVIEFLGRRDHQVKIRGFRVEPGEIEATLAGHPAVQQVAVAVHADAGGRPRLVAYLVTKEETAALTSQLQRYLRERLPEYMVPAAFVELEALPLTPTGKVNRRALPAPDPTRPQLEVDFVAPRDAAEEVVAGIWKEVLGVEQVGVHDSFFDLGGHSLVAMQAADRLRETFGVDLSLRSLFEKPTIVDVLGELARLWGSAETVVEVARTVREVEGLSEEEAAAMLSGLSADA